MAVRRFKSQERQQYQGRQPGAGGGGCLIWLFFAALWLVVAIVGLVTRLGKVVAHHPAVTAEIALGFIAFAVLVWVLIRASDGRPD